MGLTRPLSELLHPRHVQEASERLSGILFVTPDETFCDSGSSGPGFGQASGPTPPLSHRSIPLHLFDLPIELLEHILVLLCHINAQSIQACRQTCHTLNATVSQSKFVQYLECLTLLGLYDPLLQVGSGATSATQVLTLADRVAALQAWEDAWNVFVGGNGGTFWREREPDLRIAPPLRPPPLWLPLSSLSSRFRQISATIDDPESSEDSEDPEGEEMDQNDGFLDAENDFSLRPCFITATRTGKYARAAYSYLDLHECSDSER